MLNNAEVAATETVALRPSAVAFHDAPDNSRSGNQTESSRHKARGSKPGITIEAQIRLGFSIGILRDANFGEVQRLVRNNAFDTKGSFAARKPVACPKLFAHFLQKPVVRRKCQIDDFYCGRILPASRPAYGDDRDGKFAA